MADCFVVDLQCFDELNIKYYGGINAPYTFVHFLVSLALYLGPLSGQPCPSQRSAFWSALQYTLVRLASHPLATFASLALHLHS